MFLKAGALSLALLLASRLLGLVRESAQAAAFGTSGLADVVVLMLTLPDWLAGVLASGALAYVLVPAWAGAEPRPGGSHAAAGGPGAAWRRGLAGPAAGSVAPTAVRAGWQPGCRPRCCAGATQALVWSAVALPRLCWPRLWTTRLQHERDFTGMYSANLVVNGVLIAAIMSTAARAPASEAVSVAGAGLVGRHAVAAGLVALADAASGVLPSPLGRPDSAAPLPGPSVWLWAALSAGLPLALPFAARSIASQSGEGALATFNYAWKLVELPLVLAIQLVATLAFPGIAKATASGDCASTRIATARGIRTGLGAGVRRGRRTAGGRAGHGAAAVRLGPHAARGAGAGRPMGRDRRMGLAASGGDRGLTRGIGRSQARMKAAVWAYAIGAGHAAVLRDLGWQRRGTADDPAQRSCKLPSRWP